MDKVKNCLVLQDLCTYSKSSLTVVIPTLESLRIEVCPIATSVLSTQTDGEHAVYQKKLGSEANHIFKALIENEVSFDGLYSGYISDINLIKSLEDFITKTNPVFVVIDPVLGDHGDYYQGITSQHKDCMKSLLSKADLITPNYTEARLLTENAEDEKLLSSLRALAPKANIVITSFPSQDIKVLYLTKEGEGGSFSHPKEMANYPGSGDFFASVMTGLMLRGVSFTEAVKEAALKTALLIKYTKAAGYENKHGVCPALILSDLTETKVSN